MNVDEQDIFEPQKPPRTGVVVALLGLTAAIFSYLGSYAVSAALVAAEVIRPITVDHDPRPKWFAISFAALSGTFLGLSILARSASSRQVKQIDAMETDPPAE